MNTYKLFIATDLQFVSLKDYSHKYEDFKANSVEEAIQIAKAQYGDKYKVGIFSII